MANIIARYDRNFSQYIRDEIHERYFREITSIPFSCLILRFYDVAKVVALSGICHPIKVTRIVDMGLSRNDIILDA